MVLTVEHALQIDAPRNHSLETQERLRQLLDSGAPTRPDPKRPDFFEIEDENPGLLRPCRARPPAKSRCSPCGIGKQNASLPRPQHAA